MASRHNRGREHEQSTTEGTTEGAQAETETVSANGTGTGPTVDTETGVVSGAGYESTDTPEGQGPVSLEPIKLVKKLVAKDIVGRAALSCTKTIKKDAEGHAVLENDKPVYEVTPPTALYTVFGTAEGTETGETSYGPWLGFIGNFEAVRALDGQRLKSNRLILQEPAQSLLRDALVEQKKKDPGASLSFAFNVGKRTSQRWVDTNEGSSYEYTIESIINVVKHDPLAAMRQQLLPVLPKAPSPQLGHDKPA
jgi:hypothetical protein